MPFLHKDLVEADDLVRDLGHFPSSPVVLPQLMGVLNDETASLEAVVDLIKLDMGIASRVLQVANSAYYGRIGRCESIEEAVHRIGFIKTFQMVSFAAASRLLMQPLTTYGMSAHELWRRSVTAAIAAEILARRCNLNTNLAYTAGLFHGIGLVAIDTWARNQSPAQRVFSRGYPEEMTVQEVTAFGFTNAAVAASLLRSWKFPTALVETVRWQYDPEGASARSRPLACALSVARWVRDAAAPGSGAASSQLPAAWELAVLGQSPAEIDALVDETTLSVAEATFRLSDLHLSDSRGLPRAADGLS